jgi:hypothetical protein
VRDLIEALESIRGKSVNIYTKHKLFGDQHIQTKFIPEIKKGFGFCGIEESVYVRQNEIIDYYTANNEIIINGTNMQIKIVVTS